MPIRYSCLYTSQIKKKKKCWCEGTCLYNEANKKLVLKDGTNSTLDSEFVHAPPKQDEEIEFKGHIALITDKGNEEFSAKKPLPYNNQSLSYGAQKGGLLTNRGINTAAQQAYRLPSTAASILNTIQNQQSQNGLKPQIRSLKNKPVIQPKNVIQGSISKTATRSTLSSSNPSIYPTKNIGIIQEKNIRNNFIEEPFDPLSGQYNRVQNIDHNIPPNNSFSNTHESINIYQSNINVKNKVTTFPLNENKVHEQPILSNTDHTNIKDSPSSINDLNIGPYMDNIGVSSSKPFQPNRFSVIQQQKTSRNINSTLKNVLDENESAKNNVPSFNVKALIYNTLPTKTKSILTNQDGELLNQLKPFDPTTNMGLQYISGKSTVYKNTAAAILQQTRQFSESDTINSLLKRLENEDIFLEGHASKPITEHDKLLPWGPYIALLIYRCSSELIYALYSGLYGLKKNLLNPNGNNNSSFPPIPKKNPELKNKVLPEPGVTSHRRRNKVDSKTEKGFETSYPDSICRLHPNSRLTINFKSSGNEDETSNSFSSLITRREVRLYLENTYEDKYTYGDVWIVAQGGFESIGGVYGTSASLFFAGVALYHFPIPWGSSNSDSSGQTSIYNRSVFRGNRSSSKTNSALKQSITSKLNKKHGEICKDSNFMIALKPITPLIGLPRRLAAPLKVQAIHLPDSSFVAASLKLLVSQRGSSLGYFNLQREISGSSIWLMRHILSSDRPSGIGKCEGTETGKSNDSNILDPMFDTPIVAGMNKTLEDNLNGDENVNKVQGSENKDTKNDFQQKVPISVAKLIKKRILGEFILNKQQTEAVEVIYNMVISNRGPNSTTKLSNILDAQCLLLGGVYGCGKSRTILCLVLFLWLCGFSILVLSGTNVAVDRILVDLLEHMKEHDERNTNDEEDDNEVIKATSKEVRSGNWKPILKPNALNNILSSIIRLGSLDGACKKSRKYYMKNEDFRSRDIRNGEMKNQQEMDRKNNLKSTVNKFTGSNVSPNNISNSSKIVFSTCASYASTFAIQTTDEIDFPRAHFDALFIDECCQIPEYLSTACVGLCSPSLLILAGDERQLPPVTPIGCNKRSLFGKLMAQRSFIPEERLKVVNLNTQYRCNLQIARLTSDLFYSGGHWDPAPFCPRGILSGECVSIYQNRCPKIPPGISVVRVEGKVENRLENGKDWKGIVNITEANAVFSIISRLLEDKNDKSGLYVPVEAGDIGVISPYKAQCGLIKKILLDNSRKSASTKMKDASKIVVATVDAFQGQERNVIIVSVCREYNRETVFTEDPKRVNVAMSRAKEHLIIVRSGVPTSLNTPWDMAEQYGNVYDGISSFLGGISISPSLIPFPSLDITSQSDNKTQDVDPSLTRFPVRMDVDKDDMKTYDKNETHKQEEEQNLRKFEDFNEIGEIQMEQKGGNERKIFMTEDETIGTKDDHVHSSNAEETGAMIKSNFQEKSVKTILNLYNYAPKKIREETEPIEKVEMQKTSEKKIVINPYDQLNKMNNKNNNIKEENGKERPNNFEKQYITYKLPSSDVYSQSNIIIPYDQYISKSNDDSRNCASVSSANFFNISEISIGNSDNEDFINPVSIDNIEDSKNLNDNEQDKLSLNKNIHESQSPKSIDVIDLSSHDSTHSQVMIPMSQDINNGVSSASLSKEFGSFIVFDDETQSTQNRRRDRSSNAKKQRHYLKGNKKKHMSSTDGDTLLDDILSASEEGEEEEEEYDDDNRYDDISEEEFYPEEEPSGETLSEHLSDRNGSDPYYRSSEDPDYIDSRTQETTTTTTTTATGTSQPSNTTQNNERDNYGICSSSSAFDLDFDIQQAFGKTERKYQELSSQFNIFESQESVPHQQKRKLKLVKKREEEINNVESISSEPTINKEEDVDSNPNEGFKQRKVDLSIFLNKQESQTDTQSFKSKEDEEDTHLVESNPNTQEIHVNDVISDNDNEVGYPEEVEFKMLSNPTAAQSVPVFSEEMDDGAHPSVVDEQKNRIETSDQQGYNKKVSFDKERKSLFNFICSSEDTENNEEIDCERKGSNILNLAVIKQRSLEDIEIGSPEKGKERATEMAAEESIPSHEILQEDDPKQEGIATKDDITSNMYNQQSEDGKEDNVKMTPQVSSATPFSDKPKSPNKVRINRKYVEYLFDPSDIVSTENSKPIQRIVNMKNSFNSNSSNPSDAIELKVLAALEEWDPITVVECSFKCVE